MELEQYFKDGYVLSPYYSNEDIENYNEVKTVFLSKEDIRKIIVGTTKERDELLYSHNKLVLVKYECKYRVKPQDLVEKFTRELEKGGIIYHDIASWTYFRGLSDNDGFIFTPNIGDKEYRLNKDNVEDYLFKKDDHIVSFVIGLIRRELNEDKVKELLTSYINFINDVLSKKEYKEEETNYELNTYSLIMESLSWISWVNQKLTKKCQEFYKLQLQVNARKNDPRSMRILGYEYYEGSDSFNIDMEQALYWFEKYFKLTGDLDIARTIGYIYYYGRTTNGIPQGDKAFQYFAIGHIAGGNYEATYKLADCYVKGYGTPISHVAAYCLVDSIYVQNFNDFLDGYDAKFADVALRMGSFYKDGIYVNKDLKMAYSYYLKARLAIKKRLEHMEYLGDRSVAMAISKNLEKVENELQIKERIIKDGGYVVNFLDASFYENKYDIKFVDDHILLSIERDEDYEGKQFINQASNIGFIERSKKIEFKITPLDKEGIIDFVQSVNTYPIQRIQFSKDKFYVYLDVNGEDLPAFTTYKELILYPQTIKDIYKKYAIASVEFYPNSKTYDYLSLDPNIKVGDKKMVESRGERKQVTVKSIKYVYEDQLPLPFEKMGKI